LETYLYLICRYHIAHSDIAPRNILVDPHDDNIRIIDFELCEPIPPKELDIDPPSTAMEPISRVPDLGDLIEEPTEVDVDGPSTVIAVYETVTKRDPGMDGEKDWCQTPERIRARLQFVKMATWELGSGVETDVDVDSLKELVETWVEEREEVGYTWESFVQRTPLFRIFGLESTLLSTRSIS
jgi:serine/threonine protein kinase